MFGRFSLPTRAERSCQGRNPADSTFRTPGLLPGSCSVSGRDSAGDPRWARRVGRECPGRECPGREYGRAEEAYYACARQTVRFPSPGFRLWGDARRRGVVTETKRTPARRMVTETKRTPARRRSLRGEGAYAEKEPTRGRGPYKGGADTEGKPTRRGSRAMRRWNRVAEPDGPVSSQIDVHETIGSNRVGIAD